MTNNIATKNDGSPVSGKWCQLDDGSFGFETRWPGDRAGLVGKMVQAKSKAGNFEFVTIDALVVDFGAGDCAQFRCHR